MSRINFTAGRVREFRCPPDTKQVFLWDAGAPGLGLRATTGSVSYVFQSRLAGCTIRTTIGDIRVWDIDGARQKARELQLLIDEGQDPRLIKVETLKATKCQQAEAQRRQHTLADAWTAYIEANQARWGKLHIGSHTQVAQRAGGVRKNGQQKPKVAGTLASLLDTPLVELTADTIAEWLTREGAVRPTQTVNGFRLMRTCLNWCAEQAAWAGLVDHAVCRTRQVRQAVPRIRPKSDCLQREQVASWFANVRRIANSTVAAYLQVLLLTGGRPGELLTLKWGDVDFRWQTMTIRDKVEGTRTIPLTPYVASLLDALPRVNEWVFGSPKSASGHLWAPTAAHNEALQAAHIAGLTLHGLRRSFSTLTEWVECPAGIVAQIMGHKPSAIAEKHYKQRPIDLLRMWHTKIEAWILDQAGIPLPHTAAHAQDEVEYA